MSAWIIYNKDGLAKCEARKLEYSGEFLGACSVNVRISSPSPIGFELGDWLEYRGERFELNYDPSVVKEASSGAYGEGFVYENVVFNSLSDELTRCDFLDVVPADNHIHYTSLPNFSFFAESVEALAERLQANLNRVYKGSKSWTVSVHPEFAGKTDINITISNQTCWDALALAKSEFEANFIIKGRHITIGTSGIAVGNLFSYGKGNGLFKIEKNAESDQKIITRLRAYGSTRNLPTHYYQNLEGGNVPNNMAVKHLMLPSFPMETLDPYIDSKNIDALGVRESTVFFDGANVLEEIYPTMEGMTAEDLKKAGVSVNATGALDVIVSAEQLTDNGIIPEGGELQGNFKVTLKDIGFDINEHLSASGSATLAMKSGMCSGREFEIETCVKKDNGYELTCKRTEDSGLGLVFPYKDFPIKANDKFVLLNIEMPDVYIKAASQRLLTAAKDYLAKNDYVRYSYTPTLDNIFLARQHDEAVANGGVSIHDTIKEGDFILFEDEDLGISGSVTIDSLSIKEDYSESIIPEYSLTLRNEKSVGTIEKIQNQVTSILNGVSGGSVNTEQVKSIVEAVGGARFLSKTKDDRSKGLIASDKGFEVGDFKEGSLGSGASMFMREGSSYGEVDYLKVRKKATFSEITIQELKHVGGEIILSPASMVCVRVDEVSNGYKCYFNQTDSDGRKVYNEFVRNDQARCQTFNLETNTYYWRLVVEVGEDYIVLSKTDCDANSDIPKEGDAISQLGHRSDSTRQSAIILSAYGSDAPSYKQYRGINSYSLDGKQVTKLSPFGNELTGKLVLEAGSTGWENLEGLKGVINKQSSDLESFANSVTKEFENIRNEMDGAIDTWFGEEAPTLNNYPAVDWITEADMDSHLGDLYYSSNGKAYRFQYTESDGYHWAVIEDSEVVKALELAQKALDTADGKRRVFIEQPVPPYDLGDLWAGGDNAPLMRCVNARESGSFFEDDWDLADNSQKYADAIKTKLEQDLNSAKADIDQAIVDATNASKGYTDEAKAAIQASINSLEQNKADLSAVYEKAIVDGMVNDAEAEAIRQANEVAQAQRAALETRVNAYADGQISEAEQRAIDEADRLVEEAKKEFHASITATKNTIDKTISDVQSAMTSYTDEAKQALQESITQLEQAKANVDDVYSKTLIDGKVTALEEFATNEATEYANAAKEAAETNVKAWADGVIDEAEQNAINEAQKKVDAAKEDLEAAMDALEGDLTALINNTKNDLDDAIAKAKSEAENNANNYTDEGKAALQASINALNETKANISNVYTKSESDGKISQAEADAIAAAKVAADAAILASEAIIKAYADGIVSAEEQARITEAQNNLAEAKRYAEEKADEAFNDAEDLVDNLEGGKENLLRNTGFFGDYVSASLLGEVVLSETSEMYSPSLQHWSSALATAVEMSESESGKGVIIENGGFIQQSMFHPMTDGENYVFSFRGKGGSIKMSVGQYSKTFTLSSSFGLYFEKFVANGSTRIIKIEATGSCDLCELQLERGTIRSAWGMSPLDNQSAQAQYESMTYLKQAIEDGSSEFVGGLALANLLFAKDMANNVKAGMSGIYNDDHSVAFFGGGNYEQAIATALKYESDPSYQASEGEIQNMAKFVVTHGGRAILNDVVLRGYIYALGGKFKGEVEATSGVFKNVASPNNYFSIDENGNADFRGGKIGNFEVSGGWLGIKSNQTEQIGTNSLMALMNRGIVFNSATRRALMGVISSSGSEYLGKFEDKTQHIASNRGLWFDVQNSSTANLAFFGDGAGVLNGMMCGYGVQIITPTDSSIYPIENLTNGNVIIVDSISTSYLAFPTIKEVRNAIELGSGNFAVKLTVIKKGRNSVRIYGRDSLDGNTNYPSVSYMEVGANEAASFILYYDGSDYNVVRL